MEHAVDEAVSALTFEPALNQAIKRIGELARECGDKGREIDKLKHELLILQGRLIKPYRGCKLHRTECDGAPVVLEYEFEPAEKEGEFFIGSDARADVIRVWIGGHPFSYELFDESQLEKWADECLAAEGVGE